MEARAGRGFGSGLSIEQFKVSVGEARARVLVNISMSYLILSSSNGRCEERCEGVVITTQPLPMSAH